MQESKSTPVTVLTQMYQDNEGEWAFCSPRVSGAVSFRAALDAKQLTWLIAELTKAKALVEKATKATVKADSTPAKAKAPKKARNVAKDDDIELVLENTRTNRKTIK